MTTCTWDGKRLSADTRSITGAAIDQGPCQKIFQRQGTYVAIAGDVAEVMPVVRWLLNPELDEPECPEGFQIILVNQYRREYYCDSLQSSPMATPFAIGSGADYAIAAMLSGKTGPKAIKIAAKIDANTGVDYGVRSFKI